MNWLLIGIDSLLLIVLIYFVAKAIIRRTKWYKDIDKRAIEMLHKDAEVDKVYFDLAKKWIDENIDAVLTEEIKEQLKSKAHGAVFGIFPYGYQDEKTVEPGKEKEPRKILTLAEQYYLLEAYIIITHEISMARGFPMVEEERDEAIGALLKEWHGLDIKDAEKREIRRWFGDEHVSLSESADLIYY